LGRDRADLSDPDACAALIRQTRPAVVINAAGVHDPHLSAADERNAMLVNATAPGRMAEACAQVGASIVHLSSADVFDGSGDLPWVPDDTPNPINILGQSKLAGETAIRNAGARHIILRTSWVISAHRNNILKRLITRASGQSVIEVPADQIGAPTTAFDVARACQIAAMRLIEDRSLGGTYHYQGKPHVSLAEAAQWIIAAAGVTCDVVGVATDSPIQQPLNTRLDCMSSDTNLGLRAPDWKRGVNYILSDLAQAA
ncbi:MAG: sugar nucleotide-binding protein, partial [Pseudomonadota bacterium]